jgi:hypothetical protein
MSKLKLTLLTAALGLAITLTLSCSDDGGGGGGNGNITEPIKKAQISGVFQKGPFVEGTTATLNELDYDLNPTGRPYQTLITDDKGTFVLRNVELVSPYAHLIANGFFRNEVTGNKSAAPITLQAIVDVTDKDNVNVNILTHLEYYRVLGLADGGMTVKAAKKQAQKEILKVFGIDSDSFKDSEDMTIFGMSEGDAALLAISVLLLGDLSEADFTQRLMNFSQAIRTGGAWNDEAEKAKMAEWALDIELKGLERVAIRGNILGWGLSSAIPNFEKFMSSYWVANHCSGNNCFTDPRDGETYRLAAINNATIMRDPLRYRGQNGELSHYAIENPPTPPRWERPAYTLDEAQNACPAGWRVPNGTDAELMKNFTLLLGHAGSYWFNGDAGSFGMDFDNVWSWWHDSYGIALIYCVKD